MRAKVYFGGAGGSSQGLHDAGFDVVGYDNWQPAVDTHNANGFVEHLHDLSDPTLDHLLCEPHELAWFSTPCQPFSAAGDGEGEFDGRDGFPWALRILALTLPAVVIFENVKGLTFAKHRGYLSGILEGVRALGYHVEHKVLNCADYGVPQTRERFIAVGRLDGGRITWPTVTHTETAGMFTSRWVSVVDALPHLPATLMARHERGKGMTERHGERPDRPLTKPAMTIRQGGGGDPGGFVLVGNNSVAGGPLAERSMDEPAMTVGTRGDLFRIQTNHIPPGTDDYRTHSCDEPSPTVNTFAGRSWYATRPATTINGDVRVSAPGHHDPTVSGSQQADAIRVTIDELATLQGFPPGWVWCGTKTDQARQIGNAVPPRLAEVLARANLPVGCVDTHKPPAARAEDARGGVL